jgi:hypothetical protein
VRGFDNLPINGGLYGIEKTATLWFIKDWLHGWLAAAGELMQCLGDLERDAEKM